MKNAALERAENTKRRDRLGAALDLIIGSYLTSARSSVNELSGKVVKAAKDITGSSHGFAAYIDRNTGWLMVPSLGAKPGKKRRFDGTPLVFKEFTGLWGWVLKNKKALMTNDAPADARFKGVPSGHVPIEKFLAAPAVCGSDLTGIVAVANPARPYTAWDLTAVKRLAMTYAVILQRKRTEDRLKESEFKYSSMVAASHDIIYTATMDGRITFVSRKVEDYGYSPYDLAGRHILEFVHPDDRQAVSAALARMAAARGMGGRFRCRIKKKNGSYFHAEENGGAVRLDGREPVISGVIRDVTERDEMRERLVKNEETLRRLFESATDAIFVKDLKGRYLKVNRACAHILHRPVESMLGRTDFRIFPRKIAESIRRSDEQVIRTGNTIFTSENILSPGDRRVMYASKTPLRDANGTIIGILGIAKDITELKRLETELAKAQALEAVNKVARPAAHDINNILAAINGYAVLTMETLKADNPVKPEIEQILKAVKRASAITDRLQRYGSGTAGKDQTRGERTRGASVTDSCRRCRKPSFLSKRRSSPEA